MALLEAIIQSPISGKTAAVLEETLCSRQIIEYYRKWPGLDVAPYFKKCSHIGSYRCLDSGYQFFYPFVEGDENLYQRLECFSWYYVARKWEHDVTLKLLKQGDKVLEIGCGPGHFLSRIQSALKVKAEGIDMNSSALEKAKYAGLNATAQTLKDKFYTRKEYYDVICSFQVLEHISNVRGFLLEQLSLLKVGGKLVIAVPNNGSFIRFSNNWSTNFPPHHIGRWDRASLVALEHFFPLKALAVHNEPLQTFSWYYDIMQERLIRSLPGSLMKRLVRRAANLPPFRRLGYLVLWSLRNTIPGHTVLAVYQKTG